MGHEFLQHLMQQLWLAVAWILQVSNLNLLAANNTVALRIFVQLQALTCAFFFSEFIPELGYIFRKCQTVTFPKLVTILGCKYFAASDATTVTCSASNFANVLLQLAYSQYHGWFKYFPAIAKFDWSLFLFVVVFLIFFCCNPELEVTSSLINTVDWSISSCNRKLGHYRRCGTWDFSPSWIRLASEPIHSDISDSTVPRASKAWICCQGIGLERESNFHKPRLLQQTL